MLKHYVNLQKIAGSETIVGASTGAGLGALGSILARKLGGNKPMTLSDYLLWGGLGLVGGGVTGALIGAGTKYTAEGNVKGSPEAKAEAKEREREREQQEDGDGSVVSDTVSEAIPVAGEIATDLWLLRRSIPRIPLLTFKKVPGKRVPRPTTKWQNTGAYGVGVLNGKEGFSNELNKQVPDEAAALVAAKDNSNTAAKNFDELQSKYDKTLEEYQSLVSKHEDRIAKLKASQESDALSVDTRSTSSEAKKLTREIQLATLVNGRTAQQRAELKGIVEKINKDTQLTADESTELINMLTEHRARILDQINNHPRIKATQKQFTDYDSITSNGSVANIIKNDKRIQQLLQQLAEVDLQAAPSANSKAIHTMLAEDGKLEELIERLNALNAKAKNVKPIKDSIDALESDPVYRANKQALDDLTGSKTAARRAEKAVKTAEKELISKRNALPGLAKDVVDDGDAFVVKPRANFKASVSRVAIAILKLLLSRGAWSAVDNMLN